MSTLKLKVRINRVAELRKKRADAITKANNKAQGGAARELRKVRMTVCKQWLLTQYPVFSMRPIPALAQGIQKEVHAAVKAASLPFSYNIVKNSITSLLNAGGYPRSKGPIRNMVSPWPVDAVRYGLDGKPVTDSTDKSRTPGNAGSAPGQAIPCPKHNDAPQ